MVSHQHHYSLEGDYFLKKRLFQSDSDRAGAGEVNFVIILNLRTFPISITEKNLQKVKVN